MRAWIRKSLLSSYILYSALEAYFYLSTETISNIIIRSPPPFYIKLFYTKTLPSQTYLDHKICPNPFQLPVFELGFPATGTITAFPKFLHPPLPRPISKSTSSCTDPFTPRPHLLYHPAQISAASKLLRNPRRPYTLARLRCPRVWLVIRLERLPRWPCMLLKFGKVPIALERKRFLKREVEGRGGGGGL